MSLGLGQLFGGLLLGQMAGGLLGGKQEEEQPTQMANNSIGGAFQGISNSMFKGMSQEEVYRMGLGFNTLRLEPDQTLASQFESRVKRINDEKVALAASEKLAGQKNQTATWLESIGRTDLVAMLESDILSPLKAYELGSKKEEIPDWQQKITYAQKIMENGATGTIADIPTYMHGILNIDAPKDPEWMQKMTALANPPTDENGVVIPWTEQQLEVGFGIDPDDAPVFQAAFEEIDGLAKLDPVTYTPAIVTQMKLKKLGVLLDKPTEQSSPNAVQEYEYYKLHTKDIPPKTFMEYKLALKGTGVDVDVNMPSLNENAYGTAATQDLVNDHKTLVDGADGLLYDIKELYRLQDILAEAEDGDITFGMLEPFYTKASQFAESIGLSDGNQATKVGLMQSAFGAETFKMLKILGLGTKGIDTVPERIFLQESFVGVPTMTVTQLQTMTQLRLNVLLDAVEKFNKKVNVKTEDGNNSAYFKLYEQTFSRNIEPLTIPKRDKELKNEINATVSKYF